METFSSKIINKIIKNIILTTDNNNQTLSNITDKGITKTFDMKIDNVISSTSNITKTI